MVFCLLLTCWRYYSFPREGTLVEKTNSSVSIDLVHVFILKTHQITIGTIVHRSYFVKPNKYISILKVNFHHHYAN
jgi:hypothetical protein